MKKIFLKPFLLTCFSSFVMFLVTNQFNLPAEAVDMVIVNQSADYIDLIDRDSIKKLPSSTADYKVSFLYASYVKNPLEKIEYIIYQGIVICKNRESLPYIYLSPRAYSYKSGDSYVIPESDYPRVENISTYEKGHGLRNEANMLCRVKLK